MTLIVPLKATRRRYSLGAVQRKPRIRGDGETGYVYVADRPSDHKTKVGFSQTPAWRVADLSYAAGTSVLLRWVCRASLKDCKKIEARFHRENKNRVLHVEGEWYDFGTEAAIGALKALIGTMGVTVIAADNDRSLRTGDYQSELMQIGSTWDSGWGHDRYIY